MRRTKEWWAQFTKSERFHIINCERTSVRIIGSCAEDISKCNGCEISCRGFLCESCSTEYERIMEKAGATK